MTQEKIGEPKECAGSKDQDIEKAGKLVEEKATDKELVDFYTWHINFPCKTETLDGIFDIRQFWIKLAQ